MTSLLVLVVQDFFQAVYQGHKQTSSIGLDNVLLQEK